MNNSTYYILAVIISSISSLISAFNLFLLLRDRRFRVKCIPCFVSQSGSTEVITAPQNATDRKLKSTGRAGIIIYNASTLPCTVEGVSIGNRPRWFFKSGLETPIDGGFQPHTFPQTIKSREVCVFTFSPDHVLSHKFGKINLRFVGGGFARIDVASTYYDLSILGIIRTLVYRPLSSNAQKNSHQR